MPRAIAAHKKKTNMPLLGMDPGNSCFLGLQDRIWFPIPPCGEECRAYSNSKQSKRSKRESDDQADVRGACIERINFRVLDGPALERVLFVLVVLLLFAYMWGSQRTGLNMPHTSFFFICHLELNVKGPGFMTVPRVASVAVVVVRPSLNRASSSEALLYLLMALAYGPGGAL